MEPMVRREIRPKDVVARQKVGVTGWGIQDVERAGLNQFAPGAEDIVIIQPEALSLGFCVNVIGPQASERTTSEVGSPVLERRYIEGVVKLEVEVFDWLVDSDLRNL